ncbi:MAG TPA: radical SAM protein [Clostridiales bacterium]|nr:radical SAM protein [Clostridiales bacterium]
MINEIVDQEILTTYNYLVEKESLLPIKISNFYMKKVVEEFQTIGVNGPLFRSVLPTKNRWEVKTSEETRDYVEEVKHNPIENVDYIIQKYDNRLVFIITDVCFSHCQYCFRSYNLSKFQQSNLKETIKNKVKTLKEYLSKNPLIEEVIFSGGDPLSIGYANLKFALEELKGFKIRIHTRAIVYNPFVFDKKIIKLFKKHNIRLVFHINHPYEICSEVEKIINNIDHAGIHMYAQFPLLRGINDHYLVLKMLLEKMDELHIRPISIFIPDPISYSADYRLSFNRILEIMDELNWKTASWINSVRFTMDTTIGKVRRENITQHVGKRIVLSREGKNVDYYDLDQGIDKPSDVNILLWKR